jgi:CheY-like chemotaxis protein
MPDFGFLPPALPVPRSASREEAGTEPAVARASTPAARRVLVADDNEDSASSMALLLQLKGHEVRTAQDGLEAVAVAADFRPDVILLDIGMPGLDGYEACRRIRQEPWGQRIVIAALTGWGRPEDRERSREAGFTQHLVKPVTPETLEKLLVEGR